MPQRSIGETPFAITYGAKAVIPLEANFPTLKMNSFTPSNNDELLWESLDLIKQGYDANVKLRPLTPGDLVLRKVMGAAKNPSWGKLGPN